MNHLDKLILNDNLVGVNLEHFPLIALVKRQLPLLKRSLNQLPLRLWLRAAFATACSSVASPYPPHRDHSLRPPGCNFDPHALHRPTASLYRVIAQRYLLLGTYCACGTVDNDVTRPSTARLQLKATFTSSHNPSGSLFRDGQRPLRMLQGCELSQLRLSISSLTTTQVDPKIVSTSPL